MTVMQWSGLAAFALLCLVLPNLGRIACALGRHVPGRWHSYQFGDLERIGKPRVWRRCKRTGCTWVEDGEVSL